MGTHRGRRRLLTLATGAIALLTPFPVRAANTSVVERGTQFVPARVDITIGDTVSWVFESSPSGSPGHSVTFNDRDLTPNCPPTLLLNDCQNSPGDRVSRTFTAAGTYAYSCKVHRDQGMTGVVVVTAAVSSTTTSTTAAPTTTTTTRPTTTTTRATTSTTATTRPLATSSTLMSSTTTATTDPNSSVLLPGAPPPFAGEGTSSSAAGADDGGDTTTVALIVALLLAASAGGGYLLWRLRPGRV